MGHTMTISLAEARELIGVAQRKAIAIKKPITVVVVDSGGFVVSIDRMDGARPLQPSIATAKAYTAAIMQRHSNMLKEWCESQPHFFAQVSSMGHHPIVATGGGMTLRKNGILMGGLGIAGGTGEEDQLIAEETLQEAGYELKFEQFNSLKPK
jgi:uncharacterized protein GlcG (DUF336 family)